MRPAGVLPGADGRSGLVAAACAVSDGVEAVDGSDEVSSGPSSDFAPHPAVASTIAASAAVPSACWWTLTLFPPGYGQSGCAESPARSARKANQETSVLVEPAQHLGR